jgi:hypothetical protein
MSEPSHFDQIMNEIVAEASWKVKDEMNRLATERYMYMTLLGALLRREEGGRIEIHEDELLQDSAIFMEQQEGSPTFGIWVIDREEEENGVEEDVKDSVAELPALEVEEEGGEVEVED